MKSEERLLLLSVTILVLVGTVRHSKVDNEYRVPLFLLAFIFSSPFPSQAMNIYYSFVHLCFFVCFFVGCGGFFCCCCRFGLVFCFVVFVVCLFVCLLSMFWQMLICQVGCVLFKDDSTGKWSICWPLAWSWEVCSAPFLDNSMQFVNTNNFHFYRCFSPAQRFPGLQSSN